jgi:large conductance mechanosensitive channel
MFLQKIKGFFGEFQTFASRGNFIDLAVGIVIGTAFTAVTTSLVNNIITPPLGLLLGRINFADLAIPLGGTVKISYGLFVQSLISFIITALALFILVRFINRLQDVTIRRKQQEAAAPPAPADSPEVSILKEIRDILKPPAKDAIGNGNQNGEPEEIIKD